MRCLRIPRLDDPLLQNLSWGLYHISHFRGQRIVPFPLQTRPWVFSNDFFLSAFCPFSAFCIVFHHFQYSRHQYIFNEHHFQQYIKQQYQLLEHDLLVWPLKVSVSLVSPAPADCKDKQRHTQRHGKTWKDLIDSYWFKWLFSSHTVR